MAQVTQAYLSIMNVKVQNLQTQFVLEVSILLKIFDLWSQVPEYKLYFIQYEEVFNNLITIYSSKQSVSTKVIDIVNRIMLNLLSESLDEESVLPADMLLEEQEQEDADEKFERLELLQYNQQQREINDQVRKFFEEKYLVQILLNVKNYFIAQ